ncbi:MAG: hypothetical protein M0C28_35440 [Candidatus Moduliflexus flocculans]|nr:hypothetical protein [Candidatus Moduliflexus flocculans]
MELAIFAAGLALALMIVPALKARTTGDKTLAKKHAEGPGRYEFDFVFGRRCDRGRDRRPRGGSLGG